MSIACRANKQAGNENNVFYPICIHLNANFNDHDIIECIYTCRCYPHINSAILSLT